MVDRVSPERRRYIMQRVGSRDTKPEMVVRRMLHALGYRYRLHRKDLPGRPDLAFPRRRKAIFVNGCFWHGHGCHLGQLPKSRLEYWGPKIRANRDRDERKAAELEAQGWRVMTVWQCELKEPDTALDRMVEFLERA